MSKQQLNVPATLIEQEGTGEDTHGLIGKRVRITVNPLENIPALFKAIMGVPDTDPTGAEGVVIHIAESGEVFADFGDDERVEPNVGGDRIIGIGWSEGDERGDGEDPMFEVVTE